MTTAILWDLDAITQSGLSRPRLTIGTLSIPPGITAVLGPSGSGKTSLLNLLVGFERPEAGLINGPQLPISLRDLDRNVRPQVNPPKILPCCWAPADHGLWPHLTVRGHLEAVSPTVELDSIDRMLEHLDLTNVAESRPATLSLGERDRVALARAILSDAAVLVLDEPLAHVDAARRSAGWQVLRTARAAGRSIVFATQQPETALAEADWLIVLAQGQVLATGTPSELYDTPPDATVAALTGPMTWLTDDEGTAWGLEGVQGCLRPERLELEAAPDGPLCLLAHRRCGTYDTVELSTNTAPAQSKTFLTRPARRPLPRGLSVALRLLTACLLMLSCSGCEDSAETFLFPRNDTAWALPAEGDRVPAPRGVTVGPQGEVYVLDNIGRVLVLDQQGQKQKSWFMPEHSVGKPERLLVTRSGRLLVADTHYHRVVVFDPEGNVLSMFGREGEGPGEFIYPVAIAEDDRERLYVGEYGGHDRIQIFDRDGNYLSEFGRFGAGPGEFQRPSGIVWHDHKLYIVDAFNNRVHVCDEAGKPVPLAAGAYSAELHYPYDLSIAADGSLAVVEYGAGRVTRFHPDGRLRDRCGMTGSGSGELATPWGLSLAAPNVAYIADTGNRRLVRWEWSP